MTYIDFFESIPLVRYGETVVLVTAVAAKEFRLETDFFPLTVDYQEKTFAAGKIPGGFFKREGRPSEKEILTCRLIDRSIRLPILPITSRHHLASIRFCTFSQDSVMRNLSGMFSTIRTNLLIGTAKER